MLLGSLNNPALPLEHEVRRIADGGFDFVDLTLEPPGSWPCDGGRVGALLRDAGLSAVGHTAPYVPIASPFPEMRAQAHELFRAAFETFATAGISLVNVHPDPMTRLFPIDEVRRRNAEAIAALADEAAGVGIRVMVENMGRSFRTVEDLAPIFDAAPAVGLHLDVGHAHMGRAPGERNRTSSLLERFGERLVHVHVHDNFGADDLHLPLGTGSIDWDDVARSVKATGWDGTVTFEVFGREPAYLEVSRRVWLEAWANAG